MSPSQDKQDLLDAARAAVTDAQAKAEARAQERTVPKRSRGVGLGVGLAAAAVSLYLAAVRPAWFLTPPPPPDSPAVQEASIRLTLVREAQRITTWRAARGRLPGDLGEIGTPIAGLAYDRLTDSVFTLSLPFGTTLVTLRSTDSLAVFLGPAVITVSARVTPWRAATSPIVELLTVVLVIGVLASISLLKIVDLRNTAGRGSRGRLPRRDGGGLQLPRRA